MRGIELNAINVINMICSVHRIIIIIIIICHMWSHSNNHLRNFTSAKHSNLWMNGLKECVCDVVQKERNLCVWSSIEKVVHGCTNDNNSKNSITAFVMLHATWLNALFHTSTCFYNVVMSDVCAACFFFFLFLSLFDLEIRLMQSAIEQMMENYKPI